MDYIKQRCKQCIWYEPSSYLAKQTGQHCTRDFPRTFTKLNCKIRPHKKAKWRDAFIQSNFKELPYTPIEGLEQMDKQERLDAIKALMKKEQKKAENKGSEMIFGTVDDLPETFRSIQQQPLDYPLFDKWSNGGLPKGGTITFTGAPSVGKTSTALMLVAAYQRQDKTVMFVNYEGTFDEKWAQTLGVNTEELILVQPDTLEDGLNSIENIVKEGVLDAVVLDSLDAAAARASLHKKGSKGKPGVARDIDDANIALKPRALSEWFPRVQLAFRKYGTAFIIIAQQRIQMSGIMAYQGMSGGNALKHNNILNITMSRKNAKEDLVIKDESVAYKMNLKVTKAKYSGLRDGDILETYFFHDQGFNKEYELVAMSLDGSLAGPLVGGHSSCVYTDKDGTEHKIRGAKPGTVYGALMEKDLFEDFLEQTDLATV